MFFPEIILVISGHCHVEFTTAVRVIMNVICAIIPQGFNNQAFFYMFAVLYGGGRKFKWIVVESVFILDPFYSSGCNFEFIES